MAWRARSYTLLGARKRPLLISNSQNRNSPFFFWCYYVHSPFCPTASRPHSLCSRHRTRLALLSVQSMIKSVRAQPAMTATLRFQTSFTTSGLSKIRRHSASTSNSLSQHTQHICISIPTRYTSTRVPRATYSSTQRVQATTGLDGFWDFRISNTIKLTLCPRQRKECQSQSSSTRPILCGWMRCWGTVASTWIQTQCHSAIYLIFGTGALQNRRWRNCAHNEAFWLH